MQHACATSEVSRNSNTTSYAELTLPSSLCLFTAASYYIGCLESCGGCCTARKLCSDSMTYIRYLVLFLVLYVHQMHTYKPKGALFTVSINTHFLPNCQILSLAPCNPPPALRTLTCRLVCTTINPPRMTLLCWWQCAHPRAPAFRYD